MWNDSLSEIDAALVEEAIRALDQGYLPTKLGYLLGSSSHSDYASSDEYRENVHTISLDSAALAEACLASVGGHSVLDIGSSDGSYYLRLCGDLPGLRKVRYAACDISSQLAHRAAYAVGRFQDRQADAFVWDIEAGPTSSVDLWRTPGEAVTALLLGNTLSNFEQPSSALHNAVVTLRPEDRMIVSVNCWDESLSEADVLAPYDSRPLRSAILSSFQAIGATIEADLQFYVIDREVLGVATIRHITSLSDALEGRLTPGMEVRCFRSRRWLPDEFQELAERAGGTQTSVRKTAGRAVATLDL